MVPAKKPSKLSTADFVANCDDLLIPVNDSVSYFSSRPLDEKEAARLIFDPISAFPPKIFEIIPNLRLILVPFLERDPKSRRKTPRCIITSVEPPANRKHYASFEGTDGKNFLFLAAEEDGELFDVHTWLYRSLAERIAERADDGFADGFFAQLHAELDGKATGEINEAAWEFKQELLSLEADGSEKKDAFGRYRREALEETLSLYLHGLCCDIDLDAGPKQLASKHIRKRLLLFKEQLPPPEGVALFPEDQPSKN